MFSNALSKIRLPFREDNIFSLLFLLVLTVPLAFTIYTRENFEIIKYTFWLILLGVIFLVLALKVYGRENRYNLKTFPRLPLFLLSAFIIFVIVSTFFSPDKLNSIFGFYYRFANSLLVYCLWAVTFFLFMLYGGRQRLLVLVKVLVFDALVISLVGILQAQGIAYYEGLDMAAISRAPSLLGNPIFSSMFIVAVFPFAVYFGFKAERFSAKLYYGLAGFFMLACVVLLTSRGAWLGLGTGILAMLVIATFYAKNKKVIIFGILGLILVSISTVGFLKAYNVQNGRLTLSLAEENATTRLYAWGMAREAIISHPWVGVGLGNFQQYFEQNREKYLSNAVQNFDDAHNLFLQLPATAGVPATLTFIGLLIAAIFSAIKHFKKQQDYFALAVAGAIIIFSITASFTPVTIPCLLLLALLIALAFSLKETEESVEVKPGKSLRIILFVCGAGLLVMGVNFVIAEHLFYRATWAYIGQDYKKAEQLATWAIKLNPTNQLYFLYKGGSQILGNANPQAIAKTKQELIKLHPKAAVTYSMSGTLNFLSFIKTGDRKYFQDATDNMSRSLKIDPFSAGRYVRLGYFYLWIADGDTAKEWTKSGLSLDKDYLPGWLQLAKIYQVQGKKAQLIYALNNALRIRPDIMELRALAKIAKEAKDPKSVPVNMPPEMGSLE